MGPSKPSTECCSGEFIGIRPGELPATIGSRAARGVIIALLRGYKVVLSPLFTGSCRFLPSCSDYAMEAVRSHGACRGSWLALRRLSRCQPFGGAGFDPVPPARRTPPGQPGQPGRE